jgi:hypothetical protein
MNPFRRMQKSKSVNKKISLLSEQFNLCVVIHYSCESFYDIPDGKTPRVTSICVGNQASGQAKSFSIHKVAEQEGIEFGNIELSYDSLEKKMLDEFYEYLSNTQHCTWFHWNMRDINYGFAAIEHRYKVLGGKPTSLSEERKFDLARALIDIYGNNYIDHGSCGRLENLMKRNKITERGFLSGKEEADAFKNKEFVKLHQSTLRKVEIMSSILGRLSDGSLQTNAKWGDKYGCSLQSIVLLVKEHWISALVGIVVTCITAIAKIYEWFF